MADVRQMIRDEAKRPVRVNQRQFVVSSLEVILDYSRQKLELFGQVGVLWRVDFGKLQLERGEFFVDSLEDFRCDLLCAVMEELCYL